MDHPLELRSSMRSERPSGPISRIVGVYHMVLKRTLEHFFPDASPRRRRRSKHHRLGRLGRRDLLPAPRRSDGLGVEIEWLGTRLMFQPGNPSPLLATERRMVEVIVEAIDLRFRGLFNQELSHRFDRFQYQTEDLIVADYLDSVSPYRIPAPSSKPFGSPPLDLREPEGLDRRALLGTEHDPAAPAYKNLEGAPSFNARLTAIKGFHRLCDGVRTVFLVDRQGDLVRLIDVDPLGGSHSGERTAGSSLPSPLSQPCQGHSLRRTRLPGPDPLAGDQGFRRGHVDVQLQRRALAAAGHPQQVRGLVRRRSADRLARPGPCDLPGRAQPVRVPAGAALRRPARPGALGAPAHRARRSDHHRNRRRRPPRSRKTSRPNTPSGPFIMSYGE